jgi:hypothetical protein
VVVYATVMVRKESEEMDRPKGVRFDQVGFAQIRAAAERIQIDRVLSGKPPLPDVPFADAVERLRMDIAIAGREAMYFPGGDTHH